MTIEELREAAKKPISRCDCCGGKTKIYRRKLNAGMAWALCWLAKNRALNWTHINQMPRRSINSREFGKLFFWGLITEKREENKGTKRTSGIYRVTIKGSAFAFNRIKVPSHAFIQSPGSRLVGFEETHTSIIDALGKHFNYEELMRGA